MYLFLLLLLLLLVNIISLLIRSIWNGSKVTFFIRSTFVTSRGDAITHGCFYGYEGALIRSGHRDPGKYIYNNNLKFFCGKSE